MRVITELVAYLRKNQRSIVRSVDVLVEVYDPTYGLQDPRTQSVEIVDFYALLQAIDDFSEEFKNESQD